MYNIGDFVLVKVGNKVYRGIILENKELTYTVIYVGKNDRNQSFAITEDFLKEDVKLVD